MSFMDEVAKATRRHGFNPIVGDIQLKQQQWFSWYRGDVNGFHTFNAKVNGRLKTFERQTMNMPKKVCEDFVSLLWNEECAINFENENTQAIVDRVLEENDFEMNFGTLLEQSMGMGMGYMVEYLKDGETKIDFISFQNALPLEFDSTKVKSLVVIGYRKVKDKDKTLYITHLMYHRMLDGKYTVMHEAYLSDNKQSMGVPSFKYMRFIFDEATLADMQRIIYDESGKAVGVEYVVEFDASRPFFQVVSPNLKNHYDLDSPYRASVYATALPYFRVADTLFDMMMSEANDNKTRIIVDHQLLKTTLVENENTGESAFINYFDENDTTLMALPFKNEHTGQKAIEYFQGTLRMDQIDLALSKAVRLIGFRVGLGKGYYALDDGAVYQNEKNVIHSNADTWKTKKKHEAVIKVAIEEMVESILHLERVAGRYKGDPKKERYEVVFDDSIIQDDEATDEKYIKLTQAGYIPKYKAVARLLRISEEEAKQMVEEANAEDTLAALVGIEAVDDEPEEA